MRSALDSTRARSISRSLAAAVLLLRLVLTWIVVVVVDNDVLVV